MEQIRTWSDERLAGVCPYCGGRGNSRDHVPSRVLLDKPYPENLPTVLACRACNQGFSLDEEYVAGFLEMVINGADGPDARTKIVRSLDRGTALEARLMQALRTDGHEVWLEAESDRIDRVVLKLARGHVMHELSELRLEAPISLRCAPVTTLPPARRAAFEELPPSHLWPEIGSRSFTRIVRSIADPDRGTLPASSPWLTVQPGRYRYSTAVVPRGLVVRMVLREHLAWEVAWSDGG